MQIGKAYTTSCGEIVIPLQQKQGQNHDVEYIYGPVFKSNWVFDRMTTWKEGNGMSMHHLGEADFEAYSGGGDIKIPSSIESLISEFGCNAPQTRKLVTAILKEVKKENE